MSERGSMAAEPSNAKRCRTVQVIKVRPAVLPVETLVIVLQFLNRRELDRDAIACRWFRTAVGCITDTLRVVSSVSFGPRLDSDGFRFAYVRDEMLQQRNTRSGRLQSVVMLSRFSFNADDSLEEEEADGAADPPVPLKSKKGGERRGYLGFIYVSFQPMSDGTKVSWRCQYKRSKRCNRRLHTLGLNGQAIEVGMHCHDPDPSQLEVGQLRDDVKRRASVSMEDPVQIISAALEGTSEEAQIAGPSRNALRQMVYRARKDALQAPGNPQRREDIVIPHLFRQYEYDGVQENFLLCDSGAGDPNRILIFGRESMTANLGQIRKIYVDGTFSITPPLFAQVFTILGWHGSLVVTLFYALLPNKAQVTYSRALNMLKQKYADFKPTAVSCDFELALINSAHSVFGDDIDIDGCFFHLVQAVLRHLSHAQRQRYALYPDYARQVKMLLALAYVPSDHLNGHFALLKVFVDADLIPVLDYFEETYIVVVTRVGRGTKRQRRPRFAHSQWSLVKRVLDYADRTNNHAESAHRRCKTYFGVSHPGIWRFLKSLMGVQRLHDYDYNQWLGGQRNGGKRKDALHEKMKKLRNIVEELGALAPLDYLRVIAGVTETE